MSKTNPSRIKRRLESYFLQIIKGTRRGMFASVVRAFLWLFSTFYYAFIRARNWAFDIGWLRRYTPPVPVVLSIGNIVVGGTGKTPLTLMIAEKFIENYRVAILSRGYRSPVERLASPVVLSEGEGPLHPAAYCGDEPYLLALNLKKSMVIVGRNRQAAANLAAKAGAQLVILDDGMQHRKLARDFEVVVLDVRDPFGQGYFLPRGFLREGVDALQRAQLVVLNHAYEQERYLAVKQHIEQETSAPVVGTRLQVVDVLLCDNGGESLQLQGKKVAVFCAIAHPESFVDTVRHQGAVIVDKAFMPDHVAFDSKYLESFSAKALAKGAELLVCTEKDVVKFTEQPKLELPLAWVKTRLLIVDGQAHFDAFMQNIDFCLKEHL